MYTQRTLGICVLATVIAMVMLIYFTPLKHFNFFEPLPYDVSATTFWKEYQAHPDRYIFYDVRSASVYQTLHAKGAVNEPVGSMFDDHLGFPKHGKTIVLICSSGRLAGVAYGYLQNQGFFNIERIKGGLQEWVLEGLPVEGNNINAPIPTID